MPGDTGIPSWSDVLDLDRQGISVAMVRGASRVSGALVEYSDSARAVVSRTLPDDPKAESWATLLAEGRGGVNRDGWPMFPAPRVTRSL